jgi:hypothetical protein
MDPNSFQTLKDNMKKNITEIKSTLNNPNALDPADGSKFDRSIYLFQSLTKSMIAIGNDIIIENDFRGPVNPADVFISLAEQKLISTSIVPGLKKAAITMPRIANCTKAELMEIMNECMGDFNQCLNSFSEYFTSKKDGA